MLACCIALLDQVAGECSSHLLANRLIPVVPNCPTVPMLRGHPSVRVSHDGDGRDARRPWQNHLMTISWWFLIFAVWCALFTAFALWPPRRPGFLTPLTFFASWLTSELAVWHLVWQLVVAIVFVSLGALGDWPGWVGLVVIVSSWVGLVVALVAASRTDRIFESAADRSTGSGLAGRDRPGMDASVLGCGMGQAPLDLASGPAPPDRADTRRAVRR